MHDYISDVCVIRSCITFPIQRGHFPPRGRGRGPPTSGPSDSKCPPSSPVGRKRQAQRGGSVRAWRSELPAAPERGSSGDEGRSPTPAPSDSISSESDSGPEGAVHKTKQPKEFHHPKVSVDCHAWAALLHLP